MSGMGIIMSIILGGIAGWTAEKIMKADHGLLTNICVGILGALIMNLLLSAFGFTASATILPQLIVAVAGACLLIFAYRSVRG